MAPRPRPRPRLVSRQPADVANAVDDEDDLFRRNRGRTAQQWKQLEQSAAKATPFTISDDDWDIDDRDSASSSKPRKKRRPIKQDHRPRWQGTDVTRLYVLSVPLVDPSPPHRTLRMTRLSSDNEGDDIQVIDHTPNNAPENVSPNKRKRDRSRSESITPPPELPAHQRANAMLLVRQALAIQPRAPSPAFFHDDSSDTIDLDPELAKIAETVRHQVKHAHINPEHTGGPETVSIKVRWRPHPHNLSAKEQCWQFKMKRHDTFRELFDDMADLAGIMADQLVITHEHRRVFASGTPHSLRIWTEGEMEACDKHTAEYIRALQSTRLSPRHDSPARSTPNSAPQSDVDSEAESIGGDTFKLVLRSAATKDKTFPLTVRSTTTCGAIVKAFLKAAGLPDNYARVASTGKTRTKSTPFPQLMVDGDKMDSGAEIGNADLEDGDLVEIVGV